MTRSSFTSRDGVGERSRCGNRGVDLAGSGEPGLVRLSRR